jgi:hypothetical protein
MVEQTGSVQTNYIQELYEDLYIKSAMDVEATIDLISWLENVSQGEEVLQGAHLCLESPCLPGKLPSEVVGEFKQFWNTTTDRPSLDSILAIRSSLYRFQSL